MKYELSLPLDLLTLLHYDMSPVVFLDWRHSPRESTTLYYDSRTTSVHLCEGRNFVTRSSLAVLVKRGGRLYYIYIYIYIVPFVLAVIAGKWLMAESSSEEERRRRRRKRRRRERSSSSDSSDSSSEDSRSRRRHRKGKRSTRSVENAITPLPMKIVTMSHDDEERNIDPSPNEKDVNPRQTTRRVETRPHRMKQEKTLKQQRIVSTTLNLPRVIHNHHHLMSSKCHHQAKNNKPPKEQAWFQCHENSMKLSRQLFEKCMMRKLDELV